MSPNAFGYVPSAAKFIRPRKRPLSSISPAIVEYAANSTLYFAAGAAEGSGIITSVAEALWATLDLGYSPRQVLGAPRFHDQLQPNLVKFNYTFENATITFMKSRGHNVKAAVFTLSKYIRMAASNQQLIHTSSLPVHQWYEIFCVRPHSKGSHSFIVPEML
jgi:gamma-glutamyltranspeptidase